MDGLKEENNFNQNGIVTVKGGKLRRFLAELADIFVSLILAMTLYGIVFQNAFGFNRYTREMASKSREMDEILVSRSLARHNAEGGIVNGENTFNDWIQYYVNLTESSDKFSREYLKRYYLESRVDQSVVLNQYKYNTEILGLPTTLGEENKSELFVYDLASADPLNSDPVLNSDVFTGICGYFAGNTDSANNVKAYKTATDFYNKAYKVALKEVTDTSEYTNLVLDFASVMWKRVYLQSAAIIISYIISSILVFIVVPMIKYTGITIGKRVVKLEVVDRNNGELKWYQILLRGMVQLVEYCLFLPFAGFLSFGPDVLTMPLFNIGGNVTTMSLVLIVGGFLTVASIILSLVTSENQSLHGLASSTVVNSSDLDKINAERIRLESLKNEEK